ncbi:MAG: hypothetical protein IT183_09525 [Acidobacteria bacterium]|nr:hypothetical protein [Acidobacteriota bacterium]
MLSSPTRYAVAFCLLITGPLAAQPEWTSTFEDDRADQPPNGFTLAAMRQSDAGRWLVQRTGGLGYLVHRADPSAPGFALAVADRTTPDDLVVSARLKFNGASRVGGLVWRYRDDQNYHSLLLDLNRGELSMYRITAGNRIRLDVRDELELDSSAWHALKVVHVGNDIRVMLGGVRVFDEQDRRDRGTAAGKVGLVATGPSEIWFDDLHVAPPDPKRSHR